MSEKKCIFCQIIAGELPSTIIRQNDSVIVINDLYPQAPCHLLIIPKQHYGDITQCNDLNVLGSLLKQASILAKEQDLTSGFRVVINTGASAGQSVNHIHLHLLGGRDMLWPPG